MSPRGIDLYWTSGSCPSWRVLLALEVKGLDYQSHPLDFSRRQQKTPEMLAMNPRGKVPVLRDGDVTLYESLAILAYLDERYPDPPLLGTTPEETGRVWRMVSECYFYFEPAIDALCLPIYRGKALEQPDQVRAAASGVHDEVVRLEAALAGAPWLAGERISAADLANVPMVQHLRRAAGKPDAESLELGLLPLDGRYPRLADWVRRIEALPGYERTYPPHWR